MTPEEIEAARLDLENLISHQLSMFDYDADIEIFSVKIKEEKTDAIFANPNKKSFLVEIKLK